MNDYKSTLLMPKTDFEMRGKLPKKEPGYVQRWQDQNMYERVVKQNEGKKEFVFHDGPPYANGHMHIGHMLNKVIKDMICRYKNMVGYHTPYIPGWDTHGLPIETAIQKLGVDRKSMPIAEFRKKCYDYALKQVAGQMEQCIRVGTFADYKHPYLTLRKEFEARQIDVFAKMALDGLIYKGLKPVYWSPSSESALAEAEVEYHDVKAPTIYVRFKVKDGKGLFADPDNTYFVIWTTTPWTIPADQAICLNPNYTYAVVKSEKGNLIVLEEMVDKLWDIFGLKEKEIIQRFTGKEAEYVTVYHPLYPERESLVICGEHVTTESGTGCVHTASGFGEDDFNICQQYHIPVLVNVDEHGKMMDSCGEWLAGQYVDDANKTVTVRLDEQGDLLNLTWITHSYPHDWRTKKPIIFRATDQWFCSIDKIRDQLLDEIDHKVHWINEWGQIRIHNMIKDRGDWCISRQRTWGVPLPIFYCEDGTPVMEKEVFDHISNLFREYGSNVWFEREAKDLLPEGYTNPHSPNGTFKKEKDVMDVWFDSGSSFNGVLIERGLGYPADLYFEGSDQYRGWFNSSLIVGTATQGQAPYKSVLSHGMVLDGKGNKMSKSLGNTVDPIKVINQYGADILRLWVASVDYQADVRISKEILKGISDNYRKIRNTMRFILGNLNEFKDTDVLPVDQLDEVDQYIMVKLNHVIDEYNESMTAYNFADAVKTMTNYITNTLSAFYMDFTKDVLYCDKFNSTRRRQIQSTLYYNAKALMKMWSPILVFTTEELHDHFYCDAKKEDSIFLEPAPATVDVPNGDAVEQKFDGFMKLRDDVMRSLEALRNDKVIGSNMEARLTISLKDDYKDLASLKNAMKTLFIVARVDLSALMMILMKKVQLLSSKPKNSVAYSVQDAVTTSMKTN